MEKDGVTIIFLGDIYLGDNEIALSSEILDSFKKADIVIANQEGPITDYTKSKNDKCCLKSVPKTATVLRGWGIKIVSLANNHMFDYGWEGFEQTRNYLDKAGIGYLGAGKNLAEASKPLIVDIKGTKIGLLSYSWQFVQTTCATESSFGCAPLDTKLMTEQISSLKDKVDSIIVMPHWGYCEYMIPTPDQVIMAKTLIDAGATAVIGHHSHIVQGVTREGDSLMAYSLGNFAFAQYKDRGRAAKVTKDNVRGAILIVKLVPLKIVKHSIVFTLQKNNSITIDNSVERSEDFGNRSKILQSKNYESYWRRYTRKRLFKRILYWCNVLNWRYIHIETLIGLWLMLKGIFRKGNAIK